MWELDNFLFRFLELMDYCSKLLLSFIIVFYMYPVLIILAGFQLWYLLRLRKKTISAVNDCVRMNHALVAPINSLIQDSLNGMATIKQVTLSYFKNPFADSQRVC